jgi:MFS family permease
MITPVKLFGAPSGPELGPDGRKRWRAGTLVYTSGGLAFLFCWLLWGDFAWWLKERSVYPLGQIQLRQFQASDLLVGLVIGSIPAAAGMLFGPWVSVRSDRHRGRWGRRIPFLLIPTPVIAFSMAGLALTPHLGGLLHEWLGASSPGLNACGIIAFVVFWSVFDLATAVTNAIFSALINDVVPQPIIGRFFGLFRMVSLIDGIIFNYFLIGHAETHSAWIFGGIGLFYGVAFTLMCAMVKEGDYPPPPPAAASAGAGLSNYFRECFGSSYYLWLYVGITCCWVALAPINSFSVFYAKSVGLSMDTYGKYVAGSYVVSLALAYFLGALADRFHPLRVSMVAIGLYAAVMLWGGFFADNARSFGLVFAAHTVLSGIYVTVSASLGQRLFPRLRFAQFASAQIAMQGVGLVVVPPFIGAILDATGRDYRLTFLCGGLFAALGLLAYYEVHRRFMVLGGPSGYRAP